MTSVLMPSQGDSLGEKALCHRGPGTATNPHPQQRISSTLVQGNSGPSPHLPCCEGPASPSCGQGGAAGLGRWTAHGRGL